MHSLLPYAYLMICLIQVLATIDGIKLALGMEGLLAAFLAFFLGGLPVVGALTGLYGAVYAWGWSFLQASVLFLWFLPVGLAVIIASLLPLTRAPK